MVELGEQISSKVIDGVKTMSDFIECRNQILVEKEGNLLKFLKVNQEIEFCKVSTCIDVAIVEFSHVSNTAVVNATSEMPINRDSLRKLSLPSFLDCNKQSVVTFVRDLDMYFELKKVPENLNLSLVVQTIEDPFAQNWVSSE